MPCLGFVPTVRARAAVGGGTGQPWGVAESPYFLVADGIVPPPSGLYLAEDSARKAAGGGALWGTVTLGVESGRGTDRPRT